MTNLGNWRRAAVLAISGIVLAAALCAPLSAHAGAQVEEQLAPSVVAGLHAAIADNPVPANYATRADVQAWVASMSTRMAARIPDAAERRDFLATVHYESMRAGLDPQLVLGVIHHESGFHKYAISSADARGYMQVMPFWVKLIGTADQNLFQIRTNLRYGCTILRHYLNVEGGDLYRALGRYNGSLGRPEYPTSVMSAVDRYRLDAPVASVSTLGAVTPH
jgi:soluble lytic murein transglycosylase-like protein